MECPNQTAPNEFTLSGFPCSEDLKIPLILFFSIIFTLTLCGNSLIILTVITNLQLQKPMYWFLCFLSILDMAFSASVVPKVIAGFSSRGKIISFAGCVSQVFFFHSAGCSESFLYTVMAYDRFLAICKPLHYSILMSSKACFLLSLGALIGGTLHSAFATSFTFHLPYGENKYIDYIFCDIPSIIELACIERQFAEKVIIIEMGILSMIPFVFILASYAYIITAIFKINSSEGRHRAFSTCSAHITVVVIYYLPFYSRYLRPASRDVMESVVCVFYTTITPLLNPIIYTLRNKEMKTALVKLWSGKPG